MNHGPLIFLGVFFALASSWFGLVVSPHLQFGRQQQVNAGPALPRYPIARSGSAQEGREVYRALGCAYCHTQQVRQSGAHFDVVIAEAGTNKTDLVKGILTVRPELGAEGAAKLLEKLPQPVLQGLPYREAELISKRLSAGDAKVNAVLVPIGADIRRGWGKRSSVAQDYLFEQPLMLGNLRLGPDLANIGQRQPATLWHYLHLFDPKLVAPGSTMPRYPFLFEKRKIRHEPSPDALTLSGPSEPEPGYEVVPSAAARNLVAYMLSLQADAPLFEAPLPPEPPKAETAATSPPTTLASGSSPPSP